VNDKQLDLALDDATGALTQPPTRLAFPTPHDGGSPFDDPERFFEPWWPGSQAYLRRVGDRLDLRVEHLADPLASFPGLREGLARLRTESAIVAGTLMALDDDGRPDERLLRRWLQRPEGPAPAAEAAFVATDLPWAEGRSLARLPFRDRRARLSEAVPDSEHVVVSRGLIGEGVTLGLAVASIGLGAVSARRLDGRWRSGSMGDDWLRLRVEPEQSTPSGPFLVLLDTLPFEDSPGT
jgi:ATP-dependent DNA ligase